MFGCGKYVSYGQVSLEYCEVFAVEFIQRAEGQRLSRRTLGGI
jgi:hypothetical protein